MWLVSGACNCEGNSWHNPVFILHAHYLQRKMLLALHNALHQQSQIPYNKAGENDGDRMWLEHPSCENLIPSSSYHPVPLLFP